MQTLEAQGTAQARKTYARHGIGDKTFGTSFAVIRNLAKQIKTDHALALQLWATGYFEPMVVATMVADPNQLTREQAEAWTQQMFTHAVTDELVSNLLSKTPFAPDLALGWIDSPREQVGRAGWHLVGVLSKGGGCASCSPLRPTRRTPAQAAAPAGALDYPALLAKIEAGLQAAPNRKREAMNNALISIGIYIPELTEAAKEAARRIGPVEIDHGDTACKTPEAVAYIEKALTRKK
jgi:hypothetical protein